ncbi:MAG: ATP-binding cassette domain-containing protein [Tenericutes bacterium]|nr:ATP-binding cassette domain-containing protein [Mycoplasmatota bacterium]
MKIEVKNVNKSFKKQKVIDDVTVTFESGKIYGIVGKNGSGKSVFLKMICSFYIPDSGTIEQDGYNYIKNNDFPKNTRAFIETPYFISDLTGFENLKILAKVQNKITDEDILKSMEDVNIIQEKNRPYWQYSYGMKQKLGIAQVLMENPDFIILDEPFNGIEEASVKKIKELIKGLKNKDRIIIITSHIKEDITELADEVYEFEAGVLLKK